MTNAPELKDLLASPDNTMLLGKSCTAKTMSRVMSRLLHNTSQANDYLPIPLLTLSS